MAKVMLLVILSMTLESTISPTENDRITLATSVTFGVMIFGATIWAAFYTSRKYRQYQADCEQIGERDDEHMELQRIGHEPVD